jgi:hypothetical protein
MLFHEWPFQGKWTGAIRDDPEIKKTGRKAKLLPARFKRAESLRFFFVCRVAFLKALHTACAVDEFLFSCVKRVAFVADIDMRAFDRGTRFDDIAA